MKKILFVVPPLMGHVNPTLSLGSALLAKGFKVAWLSVDDNLSTLLPAGGEFLSLKYKTTDAERTRHGDYLTKISEKNVTGIESVKFLYEDVLIPLNRYMYMGIRDWVKAYEPDLIVNDHQLFSAAIVATQEGIKYATSVTAPAALKMQQDLPGVSQWEDNQVISLQQELGLYLDRSIACSEKLTIIYTSGDFFGDMELKKGYRFVGLSILERPVNFDFDWETLRAKTHQKKVLVSIGTTFDHHFKRDFFAKVIEALGNRDLSVIVVSDPLLFDKWPPNFIVASKIPQLSLLPLMDAVVCHGGHNTVCETLMQGVPLVVVPIAYDQSYVAGRVVATGSGLRLNYKRFKSVHLLEALERVLTETSFQKEAQKLSKSFQLAGGVSFAAQLLEDFSYNPLTAD
ncbi:glycosyltransferase [Olivibacter sp. CPCC 100613]|uniref:glycosyltransferase n=1 Tax=Olivibacter sp. CPCC 100613 TaxID=3079931 RepID=UPI002FFC257F